MGAYFRIQESLKTIGCLACLFCFVLESPSMAASSNSNSTLWAKSLTKSEAKSNPAVDKLRLEIAALQQTLSPLAGETVTPVTDAFVQKEIAKRNLQIRILEIQDQIELCDYMIATKRDLHLFKDQTSHQNGLTIVKEERRQLVAQLAHLQAGSLVP